MNAIEKKQNQMKQDAVHFLLNKIYKGNDILCPSYISVMITARDKAECESNYKDDIRSFKALFHAGEEKYKIALWNSMIYSFDSTTKFCRKDFTKEEFAFIMSAIRAACTCIYEANVNDPIKTNRLILRAIERSDFKLFAYHYKHDGDFIRFTGLSPTNQAIKQFAERRAPAYFAIEEKTTHKVIGYVGLSLFEESATGLLEYYIFKEYRNQGYCKEAITKLVNMALNDKIYKPIGTVQEYVYKKRSIKFNAIRARISVTNTASVKTVESCGFICEATLHKTMHRVDSGWTDEKIYYITREQL